MKTRDLLIVAAILTCSAVVIALLAGEERDERPETDTAGSAGHQRQPPPGRQHRSQTGAGSRAD